MSEKIILGMSLLVVALCLTPGFGGWAAGTSNTMDTVDEVNSNTVDRDTDDAIKREISSTAEVFTPEYQDNVSAAQEAADEEKNLTQETHRKKSKKNLP